MGVRIEPIVVPTPFRVGPVNCWLVFAERPALFDVGPVAPESLEALEAGLHGRGLRVEAEAEHHGLDPSLHGEHGYRLPLVAGAHHPGPESAN